MGLDPLASWFSCCLRLDDLAEFYRQCKSVGIQETSSGYPRIHAPELQEWGGTMAALVGLALLVGDVLHQLREVALLDGAHGDVLGNHAHPPAVLAAKKVMALPSGGPRPS